MKSIGDLCDMHYQQHRDLGAKDFIQTVVDPLLSMVREAVGYESNYSKPNRFDPTATVRFSDGEKTSEAITIDYTAGDHSGRTLMVWASSDQLAAEFVPKLRSHPSGTVFIVPRSWTAKEFSRLIKF